MNIRILFSIFFFLLIAMLYSQTPGTLNVTTTTSTAGGNFAPRNIVAIWIEDDQGNFVKTLLAYAQTRITHLNTWEASTTAAGSPFNRVDAITGATRSSHGTRICSWNATDVDGIVVPDGTYFVWMELTDKNGTGNFSSFEFEKDTVALNLNPLNVPSFSAISIDWEPVITTIEEVALDQAIFIYPNPSTGIFNIKGGKVLEVEVRNTAGSKLTRDYFGFVDLTEYPDGIYFLAIITDKGTVSKKIVKKSR